MNFRETFGKIGRVGMSVIIDIFKLHFCSYMYDVSKIDHHLHPSMVKARFLLLMYGNEWMS
jgi:hypothetical protein